MLSRKPAMSPEPLEREPREAASHLSFVAPPRGFYVRVGKPAMDRSVGAVMLVVASPIIAAVAVDRKSVV